MAINTGEGAKELHARLVTIITDIRIDPPRGPEGRWHLVIAGVDAMPIEGANDVDGQPVMQTVHQYDGSFGPDALPADVVAAIHTIVQHAFDWAKEQ